MPERKTSSLATLAVFQRLLTVDEVSFTAPSATFAVRWRKRIYRFRDKLLAEPEFHPTLTTIAPRIQTHLEGATLRLWLSDE